MAEERAEEFEPAWRRPAPLARGAARAAFAWTAPRLSFGAAAAAALPFAAAAAFSPALLSLTPTADMIAPIATARAVAEGAQSLAATSNPLQTLLLIAADAFADTPGRVHLMAKVLAALVLCAAFAMLSAVRFPILLTAILTAALGGYVAGPYAGAGEWAIGAFFVVATALLAAPAEGHGRRARREGVVAGALLCALWLAHPVAWLAGFAALSATPFITERSGLMRYGAALVGFAVCISLCEWAAPGLTIARAEGVAALFQKGASFGFGGSAAAGLVVSTVVVILAAAIFGGGAHLRGWGAGAGLALCAALAGKSLGVDAAPLFVLAAAIAALSVSSPFYDGLFEAHDRASVAMSGTAAALTMFWAAAIVAQAGGAFALQQRVTAEAPADLRAAFALVQPQGPSVARWIEEGRFSTPEAREFFALSVADQSEAFLAAARDAKRFADKGLIVAILSASDTACVLVDTRGCHKDGLSAARAAQIVFAPRLDLDPSTAAARGQSEALLYTEFRLVDETPFWDIWVRRGANLPAGLTTPR
jgi:hypothetical protein